MLTAAKRWQLPKLTGNELQSWLKPIVEQFDIHFSDAALHKRLKHPDSLLEIDVSADRPIEAISEISQEVSATLRSSVRAIKNEFTSEDDSEDTDESPEHDYFERLADISDGVSVVAVQLFIKSLRCKEIVELELKEGESVRSQSRPERCTEKDRFGERSPSSRRYSQAAPITRTRPKRYVFALLFDASRRSDHSSNGRELRRCASNCQQSGAGTAQGRGD